MKKCDDCGKKITCCKCGKMLCEPNGSHASKIDTNAHHKPCRIIGYYKVVDKKVCIDCYG